MKKKIMILILIILLIGVVYLALWVIGGMNVGSGDQKEMNNTENAESQSGLDANGREDEGFGDADQNIERSGIVIDMDLLNQKISIPREKENEDAIDQIGTSTERIATSTSAMASSTEIIEEVASSTEDSTIASSSPTESAEKPENATTTTEDTF